MWQRNIPESIPSFLKSSMNLHFSYLSALIRHVRNTDQHVKESSNKAWLDELRYACPESYTHEELMVDYTKLLGPMAVIDAVQAIQASTNAHLLPLHN